jgi:vacuolar protein sorting-associated protein IST1
MLLLQVEHIIREENMMAAQEILELFCKLVAVYLPIIEAQKFVPLPALHFTTPNC